MAGRGARSPAPAGDVPGAADLRPRLARGDRRAGARRLRAPARLDLRDGERDRLRRRGELVVRPPRRRRRRRSRLDRGGGAGAMRVRPLPDIAQLGDRPLLAGGDEDRVVAEALVAATPRRHRPLEDPGPASLLPHRAERDELADVAGLAIVDAVEIGEKLCDAVAGPAGRCDSGPAAERRDLDPGVLAEDPLVL